MSYKPTFEQGKYKGKILRWSLGKSQTKGTPCISFAFMPTSFADGKPCPQFERQVVRYFTPNTIDSVVRDLKGLGYDYPTFDQLDPAHPEGFNFEGLEIDVVCKHEEFTGKDGSARVTDKWDFALSGGGQSIAPIERKEVSQLNALFGAKLKPGNGSTAPARQPRPAETTRKTADEEAAEIF